MTIKSVSLKIECGNAAFEDDAGAEVARMLRAIAARLEHDLVIENILDRNGNTVGKLRVVRRPRGKA